GRPDVLCDWTADRAALASAIAAVRARPTLGIEVVAARRSAIAEAELVDSALAVSNQPTRAAAGGADTTGPLSRGVPMASGGGPDPEALAGAVYRPGSHFSGVVGSGLVDAGGDQRLGSRQRKVPAAIEAAMREMAPAEG